mgnify:CR=1 FL=1
MYNINRRKFLGLFGCSCCSLILPSCSTVPITERKQLSIIPEYKIARDIEKIFDSSEYAIIEPDPNVIPRMNCGATKNLFVF